jgi:hypothetical protein
MNFFAGNKTKDPLARRTSLLRRSAISLSHDGGGEVLPLRLWKASRHGRVYTSPPFLGKISRRFVAGEGELYPLESFTMWQGVHITPILGREVATIRRG